MANKTLSLAALVAATASPLGFTYATEKAVEKLVKAGDAELSKEAVNPQNATEFAVRATDAGKAKLAAIDEAKKAPAPAFTFITGPALERKERANPGGRKAKYPFADFPAPTTGPDGKVMTAKIFVPATAAMPDPVKSLSSTVSGASRDYAKITATKTIMFKGKPSERHTYEFSRKFAVSAGEQDGVKGAFIERIV